MNELNDILSPTPADVFILQAELRQIIISTGHDYWGRQGEGRMQAGVKLCAEIECVAGKGLVGDRYFGFRNDFKGQVTFFDYSVYEEIKLTFNLPKLPPSVFRRNLVISGVNLKSLIGKTFWFQGIQFEGCQECTPCIWMDRTIAEGVQAFMKTNGRGGLRAKILTSGILRRDI